MPYDPDSASRLDIHRYFSKFIVTTVINVRRICYQPPNGLRPIPHASAGVGCIIPVQFRDAVLGGDFC